MSEGTSDRVPAGTWLSSEKAGLQRVLDRLKQSGYRVVGPRVAEGAIIYDDISKLADLPLGILDEQDGGKYRLAGDARAGYFDHVVGPHSLKSFVFPPRETLQELQLTAGGWQSHSPCDPGPPVAVIGARSCDLHGLKVLDRVFLEGPYVDPNYKARRERLFLLAINCRRAAATCFCHSMRTGPAVSSGFDLALTESDDRFVIEVGTDRGGEILAGTGWTVCDPAEIDHARQVPKQLEQAMHQRASTQGQPRPRSLDTTDIRDLLLGNLTHPRWKDVAERCLSCANCTMVCPTCFCGTVEDVADLTGEHVTRERTWASCFTTEHSWLSAGPVRNSTASRYRQWLTHKLASWIDQFGTSGCVGCGRCITWCPVGIDLTEEVAAIRGEQNPC